MTTVNDGTVDTLIYLMLKAVENSNVDYDDKELIQAVYSVTLNTTRALMRKDPELRILIQQAAQVLLLQTANEAILN